MTWCGRPSRGLAAPGAESSFVRVLSSALSTIHPLPFPVARLQRTEPFPVTGCGRRRCTTIGFLPKPCVSYRRRTVGCDSAAVLPTYRFASLSDNPEETRRSPLSTRKSSMVCTGVGATNGEPCCGSWRAYGFVPADANDVALCGHKFGVRVSEVLGHVVGVARFVEVLRAGHFLVGFTFGRVRRPEAPLELGCLAEGVGRGHIAPGSLRQRRPAYRRTGITALWLPPKGVLIPLIFYTEGRVSDSKKERTFGPSGSVQVLK